MMIKETESQIWEEYGSEVRIIVPKKATLEINFETIFIKLQNKCNAKV